MNSKSKTTLDIAGQSFGEYLVIEHKGRDAQRNSLWLVRCTCGKEEIRSRSELKTGRQSCGCVSKYADSPHPNFKDHTGNVFNYLTAIEPVGKDTTGNYKWKMRCVCGTEIVRGSSRDFGKRGNNSCGCVKINVTHGLTHTKPYNSWSAMKKRCNDLNYEDYGGRGITYNPKWETFDGFWKDMQEGYVSGLTIDRKNVNGHYCKDNCRWIKKARQCQGTRKRKDKWTSKFKGVALQANGTWLAQTQKDRVVERAGPYVLEEDAAKAYDAMVLRLFGEFATTNQSLGLL